MFPPNAKQLLITGPATEPLDLDTAKRFLRVDISADDTLIGIMISAARIRVEQILDRSLITTTWQYTIDYLPFSSTPFLGLAWPFLQYGSGGTFNRVDSNDGSIILPSPPLIAISSFTYIDQDGNTVPIDVTPEAGNVIVSPGTPGKIYPAYGKFYPFGQPRPQGVNITYTAGNGPDATFVPANIVTAMMFLLGDMYENQSLDSATPQLVIDLLSPSKWGGYA
jgi:hypothetical protein